jgi:hypothetical protein
VDTDKISMEKDTDKISMEKATTPMEVAGKLIQLVNLPEPFLTTSFNYKVMAATMLTVVVLMAGESFVLILCT